MNGTPIGCIGFRYSRIRLTTPKSDAVALVAATQENLDQLREWKNNDREYFFHTDLVITAEQQQRWFDG